MNHAHGIFDRYNLRHAFGIQINLGAPQTWQNEQILPRQKMRMVEFRCDVNGQSLAGKCLDNHRTVGRRTGEIAAQTDEGFCRSVKHGSNCTKHIMARLARRFESEFLFQRVKKRS
ncbi:hypothetical protein FQZ97_996230 [compost metagenome]